MIVYLKYINLYYKIFFYFIDALLSDISYSHSEDSSYEDAIKGSKPIPVLIKKCSANNILKDLNTKTCEVI